MLIPIDELIEKYSMDIRGVIHIGGHIGEEIPIYKKYTNCIHVFEPQLECFDQIDCSVNKYCVALGDSRGELDLFMADNKQSSSLLMPKLHLSSHPDVGFNGRRTVKVLPLDDFEISGCNFLNIDVQGYELKVLKGGEKTLKNVDYIYTEINDVEVYEGCALVGDLDLHLKEFKRVETAWYESAGWGDALYIRL